MLKQDLGKDQNHMMKELSTKNNSGELDGGSIETADTVVKTLFSEEEKEKQTSNNIVLQTNQGKVTIPISGAGIEFIINNPDLINIEEIRNIFKDYNGSFESIENIFNTLQNQALERLKNFDGNIKEIFGDEFTKLVGNLNKIFKGTSKRQKNIIESYTGNKVRQFLKRWSLNLVGEGVNTILTQITGAKNFVVEAGSKIKEKSKEAKKINTESKEEFKRLLTYYTIQKILKYILEQKINSYSTNQEENTEIGNQITQNYEKELFEARLRGINSQLASITLTLNISNEVSKKVDSTVIDLKIEFDNLVNLLNNLIMTVKNIQTLNDMNEITRILKELKEVSIDEVGKAYLELIEQNKQKVEGDIEYHKTIQETYENIIKADEKTKHEIDILEKKLKQEERKTAIVENKIFNELKK